MIRKEAKSGYNISGTIPSWMKYGVALEIICCGLGYGGWRKLNHDQEARLFMYKNGYQVLNVFYLVGETIDKNYKQRDIDLEYWTAQQKI